MTMQRLCHSPPCRAVLCALAAVTPSLCAADEPPAHDYPTHARVEYVNDCIARHGGRLSNLYQCSCVIDRIADALSYDEFVEAGTFAKYSGLGGEAAGIFRDSDDAKQKARRYRELEGGAERSCGLTS